MKTIRNIILCGCLFLATVSAAAQADGEKWSLRECIDYAVENNIEIKQQALRVEDSEISLNSSQNSRLPSLNANVNENIGFGRSKNLDDVYENKQSSSTSWGLSTSVPVFSGMRITNQVKANEWNLKSAIEGLERAKENLGLQITSYYLDVLLKKELLKVAEIQIELTLQQQRQTEVLVAEGKVPQSQLFDIKAQAAQNEVSVTSARNNVSIALLNLSQSLNLPDFNGFDIAEPGNEDQMMALNPVTAFTPDDIYDMALGIKPHIKEAEFQVESSKASVKVAESSFWPSVNLSMSYGNQFRHIFGEDNMKLSTQIKEGRSQSIGLGISIPIFNRLQTRNQVRSAKLNVSDRMLVLDNVKLSLYKEIQQAYVNAMAAENRYKAAQVAYHAAEESYKYIQERYRVGKATVFEFNESQSKLVTSLSEQLQAKYDYVFGAKILDFYRGEPIDIR